MQSETVQNIASAPEGSVIGGLHGSVSALLSRINKPVLLTADLKRFTSGMPKKSSYQQVHQIKSPETPTKCLTGQKGCSNQPNGKTKIKLPI
jgi:hypothetical protein